LSIQPRTASSKSGKSQEDILEEKAQNILNKIPKQFDLELLSKQ